MRRIAISLILLSGPLQAQNGHNFFFSKEAKEDEKQVLEATFPESSSVSEEEATWPESDISPDFPELQIFDRLDPEKSMEGVKRARLLYLESVKAIKEGEHEAKALEEKINALPVQHEWQRREREQSLARQQSLARLRARRKAIGFTVKALETLDKVKNPGIMASSFYKDLKAKTIRQYVRLQLSTGSISGVIEMIHAYFDLKESHKQESEPYRVLAIVYRKLELMAQQRKAEKEFNEYKRLKNENLLKFTEMAHGKDSNEYDYIREQIRRDIMERLP
mgnify:CR=1 FL=1